MATFTNNGGSDIGVLGESTGNEGVRGLGHSVHPAVVGINDSLDPGNGGWFQSSQGEGVRGWSMNQGHAGVAGVNTASGLGIFGSSDEGAGVWGSSKDNEGVHAETHSTGTAAMAAYQLNPTSDSAAFFAKHVGNRTAGVFVGNVIVTGDITLSNADCAEDFDVASEANAVPGSVMVLGDGGALTECDRPYDKRVAGVVSGAGDYKAALVLDKQNGRSSRTPVALLGKVFCKVDAFFGPIEVGDLLTTSPTPGHAMRAGDPSKAFGSVIGKAMRSLADGRGLIPILIALQ